MMNRVKATGIIVCFIFACLLTGCIGSGGNSTIFNYQGGGTTDTFEIEPSGIETFKSASGVICEEDGKPVIRMFSTTWCPHCQWISDTYNDVVKKYVDEGLIVAHHWEIDTGDDTLTSQVEQSIPDTEWTVFTGFNPRRSIPTFVFGCKYYRVGNAYEQENDLRSESAEFKAVIKELIKD